MADVLIPLPSRDFDPTEAAVSWCVLTDRGHRVWVATPEGRAGQADDIMVTGRGLDLWSDLPLLGRLPLVGAMLRADRAGREAWRRMNAQGATTARTGSPASPLRWQDLEAADFAGVVLPGGHRARGMREYLESELLQALVVDFFRAGKPVGAICHGVVLAARSIDPTSARSVLWGRRTTALTWELERTAWSIARWTRFRDPGYYRTYDEEPGEPAGYRSVQAEVTRALERPEDFLDVPADAPMRFRKASGLTRDRIDDDGAAFVVRDGNYVSARWPGDAHTFARTFAEVLES